MKVLHVLPSTSPRYGGPTRAMAEIERALYRRGIDVVVATTDQDGAEGGLAARGGPVAGPFGTRWTFPRTTAFYAVSFDLMRWLKANVGGFDVVHTHALFSFPPLAAARAARAAGVPYVMRPLGVLAPYGMTQRRPLLKKLSLRLVERSALEHAAAVHFTSAMEAAEARALGLDICGTVIPLGIEAELAAPPRPFDGRLELLYLSRLDPKKNLEALIQAMALLIGEGRNVRLTVAGDGKPDYVRQVKAEAVARGVADRIAWCGHIDGAEKAHAFAATHLFVLPSYAENFGIAVVEALAAGVPCIVSRAVAIAHQVDEAQAGIVTGTDAVSIAQAIRAVFDRPRRLAPMAAAARKLAEEAFSLDAMGERLAALYRDVLTGRRTLRPSPNQCSPEAECKALS
jgi:glycosyltransferase involved in cell wall biosynthesis